ncbi:MAG: dephospho-CoA kinase [Gammaproteobacteria bacterium]
MLTIGLTGGIASGKSAAAHAFAALGVPVIDTDELAREALAPGSKGLARAIETFGREYLDADGSLDRARLRRRVFADPEARKALEAIVHPRVRELLAERLTALHAPYAIVVVPLLVEAGMAKEMDRVLVVDCPEALQVERLMARDGETEASARAMIAAQAPRKLRLAASDDVIENDAGLDHLAAQVRTLHESYLKKT